PPERTEVHTLLQSGDPLLAPGSGGLRRPRPLAMTRDRRPQDVSADGAQATRRYVRLRPRRRWRISEVDPGGIEEHVEKGIRKRARRRETNVETPCPGHHLQAVRRRGGTGSHRTKRSMPVDAPTQRGSETVCAPRTIECENPRCASVSRI